MVLRFCANSDSIPSIVNSTDIYNYKDVGYCYWTPEKCDPDEIREFEKDVITNSTMKNLNNFQKTCNYTDEYTDQQYINEFYINLEKREEKYEDDILEKNKMTVIEQKMKDDAMDELIKCLGYNPFEEEYNDASSVSPEYYSDSDY